MEAVRLIEAAIAKRQIPGAVIRIRHGGKIVLREARGFRQLEPIPEPMELSTLFDLASLTKPLATTPVALAVLRAQGIDRHRRLRDFLPEVPGKTGEITLFQLMTHTGGLPPVPEIFRLFPTEASIDPIRGLAHLFSLLPEADPGGQVIYSCTGYVLLTQAIRRITLEELGSLFCRLITGPGKIPDLLFNPGSRERGRCAATEFCPWRGRWIKGEVHDENSFCLGGQGGNAGLFGSADGVGELLGLFSGGGIPKADSIFSPEDIQGMTRTQTGDLQPSRALGFLTQGPESFAGPGFSPASFGHTGFTGTSVWIDPERDLEVVLLTNRVHFGRENTADSIKDLRLKVHQSILRELG